MSPGKLSGMVSSRADIDTDYTLFGKEPVFYNPIQAWNDEVLVVGWIQKDEVKRPLKRGLAIKVPGCHFEQHNAAVHAARFNVLRDNFS